MFSLVFVSVKLSGEYGNHLPLFPGGETLGWWLFPGIIKLCHRVTCWLRSICLGPSRIPLLPLGGEWAQKLLDRFPVLPGRGADSDDRVLGLLSRSLHTWSVAFLTPTGKTRQPHSIPAAHGAWFKRSPNRLCVSLLHNLHLNLNS